MTNLERRNLKVRILRLTDLKSTGSPAELAARLGIGERTTKRYVSYLRDDGHFIRYCPVLKTYVNEKGYV
ncbi:MAG: hypothetical protein WAL29_16270 [Bacteroidales bacterium]